MSTTVLKNNYKNYELLLIDDGVALTDSVPSQSSRSSRSEVDYLRLFPLPAKVRTGDMAIACGLDNGDRGRRRGDAAGVRPAEFGPTKFVSLGAESCRGIVVGSRNLLKTRSRMYKLAYDIYYRICTNVLERPQIYCSTHFIALSRTAINSMLKIKSSYRYLRVSSMYAGYQVIKCEYEPIRRRKDRAATEKPLAVLDDWRVDDRLQFDSDRSGRPVLSPS